MLSEQFDKYTIIQACKILALIILKGAQSEVSPEKMAL